MELEARTAAILTSLVSIAGLLFIYFWLYRGQCVAKLRQDMFDLRDELFELALRRNISFEHQSYSMLRTMMNGYIRFGHHLSLLSVIAYLVISRAIVLKYTNAVYALQWLESLKGLDEQSRRELNAIHERMNSAVAKHLLLGSPILFLVIILLAVPVAVSAALSRKAKSVVESIKRAQLQIDSIVAEYGRVQNI